MTKIQYWQAVPFAEPGMQITTLATGDDEKDQKALRAHAATLGYPRIDIFRWESDTSERGDDGRDRYRLHRRT